MRGFHLLLSVFALLSLNLPTIAQPDSIQLPDSISTGMYAKVNQCTPWHHLKCIYTTGKETYRDARSGKKTKHWWTMSYIGRACTSTYGKFFGIIYEVIFVLPHYIGVAIATGFGHIVFKLRGPKRQPSVNPDMED